MESNQNNSNNGGLITPDIFKGMPEKTLFQLLEKSQKASAIAFMLKEITFRQQKVISDMESRIAMLENKTLKTKGRKKQEFFVDGRLLTDSEIVRLIDGDFYKDIRHLEKDVGANKNVLRNRYNKEKKRLEMLERQQTESSQQS